MVVINLVSCQCSLKPIQKLTIIRLCSAPMGTPGRFPKPSAQLTCLSKYSARVLVGLGSLDRSLGWLDRSGIDGNRADYLTIPTIPTIPTVPTGPTETLTLKQPPETPKTIRTILTGSLKKPKRKKTHPDHPEHRNHVLMMSIQDRP